MAGNAFIQIEGCEGESRQNPFEKQIEISEFNWEVTAETSFTKGGGASVGKAIPGTCSWKHYYDSASPNIMANCVKGMHFSKITATMCKSTGGDKPEKYFWMVMEHCFITKANIEAGEDGNVNQSVDMVFKHVVISYKKQEDSGKLVKEKSLTWDIPAMTCTTG